MDITHLEQQAIDFARRGDFGADAKQVNEELTRLVPDNEGAWTRLARCNIELGLLDDANTALETVLRLNPQNTIARSLLQESIRRAVALEAPEPAPKRKRTASGSPRVKKKSEAGGLSATRGGFGRAQIAALGQLPPAAAVESLAASVDALLASLNERPFAAKVVETRNRAGQPGNRLFRRGTLQPGAPGHVFVVHYGGRWEPQINVGFFASPPWERAAVRAGIGFNLSEADPDTDPRTGQERAAEYFERFQRLVSSQWKQLLTGWMAANAGFVQQGEQPPDTSRLPEEAVAWLTDPARRADRGWIFVGRWLFADRPADAAIMEDGAQLAKWLEQTFVELLPLWTSLYRD